MNNEEIEIFDLKSLLSFCKVVELKSFSEAAGALYVTQPTISGHINKLEKALGITLIDRQGKSLELTDVGKVFYKRIKKIIKELEDTKYAIEEIKGFKKGIINIGASTIPGEYLLPKIIAKFSNEYPEIHINVHIKDTFTIIDEILHGNYDFGIVGSKESHNKLVFKELILDKIILVAEKNFPIPNKLDIFSLKKFKFIAREKTSGTFHSVNNVFKNFNLKISDFKFYFTINSLNAVKELLKTGTGITFISKFAVKEELEKGILKEVKVNKLTPINRYFYFIKKKNSSLSNSSRKFYEIMLKFLNNYVN